MRNTLTDEALMLSVRDGDVGQLGVLFERYHGMLFDFQTPQPVAFWMKNTPLPLDMLFIDAMGTVVRIAANTVPFSETPVPSEQPIRAVLEVNAGTAQQLGIRPGAKVRHAIFSGAG